MFQKNFRREAAWSRNSCLDYGKEEKSVLEQRNKFIGSEYVVATRR
jgi:hypothetical protein